MNNLKDPGLLILDEFRLHLEIPHLAHSTGIMFSVQELEQILF